jgi:hypothetical protein
LVSRLRLADVHSCPSPPPTEHGKTRRQQVYSAGMLVEESRLFQVGTFQTVKRHQRELDQNQLLLDVMLIADEVDLQLMQAVNCWEAPALSRPALGSEL